MSLFFIQHHPICLIIRSLRFRFLTLAINKEENCSSFSVVHIDRDDLGTTRANISKLSISEISSAMVYQSMLICLRETIGCECVIVEAWLKRSCKNGD